MNWSSQDASAANSLNFFDSNSHCFNKIREDSPSLGGHLFAQNEGTDFPFNFQNTVNFMQLQKNMLKAEQFDPLASISQSDIYDIDSPTYLQEGGLCKLRKGLKDLASILLQTFKHRRVYTQSEIVKCVQSHLFKSIENDRYECKKVLKNIKRRIYDAINVMISADLLQRNANEITLKPTPTVQVYLQKFQQKRTDLSLRIQKKRDLYYRLKSKNNAIKNWIKHNRTHWQTDKLVPKLRFPLIFVLNKNEDPDLVYQEQVLILKNAGLQFYSEADVLESMYECSPVKSVGKQEQSQNND